MPYKPIRRRPKAAIEPAHIEIVQVDHTYTATVYSMASLLRYCQDLQSTNRQFRVGGVLRLGSIPRAVVDQAIDKIKAFSNYDTKLPKPE
jgi:hypothetical protein